MAYVPITSRQALKNYCLKKLGAPVITINVDDDQVEDRLNDAIQYFQEYHYDATRKVYIAHQLSAQDISSHWVDLTQASGLASTNANSNVVIGNSSSFSEEFTANVTILTIGGETKQVINIASETQMTMDSNFQNTNNTVPIFNVNEANSIQGVTGIFPISSGLSTLNMFDLRYQMRLNDLYDFTSGSYTNFVLTMQHIRTLEFLFTPENSIRFERHQNRLYLDWQWGLTLLPGEFIIIEAYKIVDPDSYPLIYDDKFLKAYATALIRKQWGSNLIKFPGVQLPGGVVFNGQEIFNQAQIEIDKLEAEIRDTFEQPVTPFFLG